MNSAESDSMLTLYDRENGELLSLSYPYLPDGEGYKIAAGRNGSVIIMGHWAYGGIFVSRNDWMTGVRIWTVTLDQGDESAIGHGLAMTADGNPVVAGTRNFCLLAESGKTAWMIDPEPGQITEGRGVAFGPDGSLYLTGEAREGPASPRYVPASNIRCVSVPEQSEGAQSSGNAYSGYLSIAPDGSPAVTGTLDDQFYTVIVDRTTGNALWASTLGSAGVVNWASGVSVGPNGNPVVAVSGDYPDDEKEHGCILVSTLRA